MCACVCHVFGIVMSFHMSPSHQLRFPDLAPERAAAVGARCRVCGDPSQHWQHCI